MDRVVDALLILAALLIFGMAYNLKHTKRGLEECQAQKLIYMEREHAGGK